LKVTNMNKQIVSYVEACNLFKDHCEVLLKGRQLNIFEYEIEIMEVLKMIKDSNRLLYNEILFKWCADVGLHIT
jgi:hypothetical protein